MISGLLSHEPERLNNGHSSGISSTVSVTPNAEDNTFSEFGSTENPRGDPGMLPYLSSNQLSNVNQNYGSTKELNGFYSAYPTMEATANGMF